jgi:hypothetical protein
VPLKGTFLLGANNLIRKKLTRSTGFICVHLRP